MCGLNGRRRRRWWRHCLHRWSCWAALARGRQRAGGLQRNRCRLRQRSSWARTRGGATATTVQRHRIPRSAVGDGRRGWRRRRAAEHGRRRWRSQRSHRARGEGRRCSPNRCGLVNRTGRRLLRRWPSWGRAAWRGLCHRLWRRGLCGRRCGGYRSVGVGRATGGFEQDSVLVHQPEGSSCLIIRQDGAFIPQDLFPLRDPSNLSHLLPHLRDCDLCGICLGEPQAVLPLGLHVRNKVENQVRHFCVSLSKSRSLVRSIMVNIKTFG